ncbi:nek3, partial [Symbiodinium sp. CCMP2456]
ATLGATTPPPATKDFGSGEHCADHPGFGTLGTPLSSPHLSPGSFTTSDPTPLRARVPCPSEPATEVLSDATFPAP